MDAGNYRVTIKGVTFSDSGQYFIDINKRDLDSIAPSNAFAVEDVTTGIFRPTVVGHVYYYAYTGEEIAPEFTFTGDDGKTYTVPADEFEVTYNKDELKDKGDYVVTGVKFDSTNYENDDSAAITLAGTSKIVRHRRLLLRRRAQRRLVRRGRGYRQAAGLHRRAWAAPTSSRR